MSDQDIIAAENVQRDSADELIIPVGYVAAAAPEILNGDGGKWREGQDRLNSRVRGGETLHEVFSRIMDNHPSAIEAIVELEDHEVRLARIEEQSRQRDQAETEWKAMRREQRIREGKGQKSNELGHWRNKEGMAVTCCKRCGWKGRLQVDLRLDDHGVAVCTDDKGCREYRQSVIIELMEG